MINIDHIHPFQSHWDESNAHLKQERNGVLYYIINKVKNFVFFLPNSIIAACINPRYETEYHPYQSSKEEYEYFSKEIVTPDQVHLTTSISISKSANSTTSTVILFNPLGANDSVHHLLKDKLLIRGCNVVAFDYRGLGNTRRAEDLIVDGESIYQYVTQELGINKDSVNFYGFSLGGVIAAQVKALHPDSKGKYLGDRPFRSVFRFITENCCIEKLGWVIKKITSLVSSIFVAYPIYLLGWEWDGKKALNALSGDKCIIYHPNDCLVPFAASLASICSSSDQIVRLDPKVTGLATHFASIGDLDTAEGDRASNVAADFLANSSQQFME